MSKWSSETLSHPYVIALAIFLCALAVRVYFLPFSLIQDQPLDPTPIAYDGYYQIAENVMAGHGFSRASDPWAPDSVRMPLYPLIIVAIVTLFGSYKALLVIQAIIGSITALLSWLLAKEFLNAHLSALVGFAIAIEPLSAYLTGTILTETLFTAVFLCAVYFFLRYLKNTRLVILALSTLLLGLATLIRPTTQYVPLIMLAILFWSGGGVLGKRAVKEVLIVLGVFCLILSPWIYRNYVVFGSSELTAQTSSTLYAYLVPSTIALERGISYEEAAAEFFEREHSYGIEEVNLGNAAEFKARAFAELRKHPMGLLQSILVTQYAFFTNDGYATILDRRGVAISYAHPPLFELVSHPKDAFSFFGNLLRGPSALVIIGRLFWIITTLLAAAGALLYWRKNGLTIPFIWIVLLIAYFALTTSIIGSGVNGRLRVPVQPFIFIFALVAVDYFYRAYRTTMLSTKS